MSRLDLAKRVVRQGCCCCSAFCTHLFPDVPPPPGSSPVQSLTVGFRSRVFRVQLFVTLLVNGLLNGILDVVTKKDGSRELQVLSGEYVGAVFAAHFILVLAVVPLGTVGLRKAVMAGQVAPIDHTVLERGFLKIFLLTKDREPDRSRSGLMHIAWMMLVGLVMIGCLQMWVILLGCMAVSGYRPLDDHCQLDVGTYALTNFLWKEIAAGSLVFLNFWSSLSSNAYDEAFPIRGDYTPVGDAEDRGEKEAVNPLKDM